MNIRYDRAGDILMIDLGPLAESPGAINPAPGVYVDITEGLAALFRANPKPAASAGSDRP